MTGKMKPTLVPPPNISDELLRIPLLESLYRDRIPPTAGNLRCRWAEIICDGNHNNGTCRFSPKITSQDVLKMYAGRADTLVVVDQKVDEVLVSNGTSRREALLKGLEGNGPGTNINAKMAWREASKWMKLRHEPEIFLVGFRRMPEWALGFVDPFGADTYPEQLWKDFEDYLEDAMTRNATNEYTFSSGRYGAAKELSQRNLSFFQGLSLGEVAHIVQLALTSENSPSGIRGRGLLSYQADKTISPRALSERHILADLGLPCSKGLQRRVGQDCTTEDQLWQELRRCVTAVLQDFPDGRCLALLKVDVEQRFGMQLDQSLFHEVKLSHVFESPRLRDVVEVRRMPQKDGPPQVIIRLRSHNVMAPANEVQPLMSPRRRAPAMSPTMPSMRPASMPLPPRDGAPPHCPREMPRHSMPVSSLQPQPTSTYTNNQLHSGYESGRQTTQTQDYFGPWSSHGNRNEFQPQSGLYQVNCEAASSASNLHPNKDFNLSQPPRVRLPNLVPQHCSPAVGFDEFSSSLGHQQDLGRDCCDVAASEKDQWQQWQPWNAQSIFDITQAAQQLPEAARAAA